MGERPDPLLEAHVARMAADHQAAVLPGLSDERLQLIAERLTREADGNASSRARLVVVRDELRRRTSLASAALPPQGPVRGA